MKHKNRLKLVRVPESGSLLKLRGGDVGIVQVRKYVESATHETNWFVLSIVGVAVSKL